VRVEQQIAHRVSVDRYLSDAVATRTTQMRGPQFRQNSKKDAVSNSNWAKRQLKAALAIQPNHP
jgi:hypothetical protein